MENTTENKIDNKGDNNIIIQKVGGGSTITIHHHTKPKLPKDLTVLMPTVNLKDVIGREEEIAELHQSLFENKQVVLVNGLGGIGKTTLSQSYLTKYAEQYQHLMWITVGGTSLESDFINAVLLDKTFGIKTEGKEVTNIFHEVLHNLKAIDAQPNLLILDNADATLSSYYDRLPRQPHWHILVTSREHIEGFESKELGFLKPDKALLLFQKHCTRITDIKAIETLLRTIDYHTLTIEILAKTAQLQRLDIATLQNAIEKDIRARVKIKHNSNKEIDKVYTYLSSIFDLSNVTEAEAWLLKQMACLPTDFHAYDLIKELICKPESEQAELLPESIESLVAKGWLLKNPEADSYKMHIIIAEVSRRKLELGISDVEVLLDNTTQKLSIDQTKDNPVDKFQWVEFGKALESIFEKELLPKVSVLQNNLALVLKDLGEYENAKILLQKALISDEKNFGEEHPTTAVRYSNLALVLKDLGEYEKAKILLQKALISDEKNFGEEHPSTAVRYSNLALVLKALGEYEKAKILLQKALISAEKNFGEEHPSTAVSYSNLALVLKDLGEYENAKILLQKALISDEKNFGEEHPTTAVRYSNLATVLQDLGDYEKAKILLQKALISDEKNFGEEHPTTAVSYSNLATVLIDLGEYEKAKILLQKALISAEKNFGEEHPTTAVRYSTLALVLKDLGDYAGAKALLQKALMSIKKTLEKNILILLFAILNWQEFL
ncbi:tetratricopeptide repeat protein [Arcicella rigui]|uniref:Tetratricopeptide repeat protein n=1 Tax=Arcicella rigui TaxID=797020 RepID=A0ABU5QCW4_9BACT|nr:tetratricopeptide repeat protein [Arcicella rigui]MEA5140691.1 tetratricopeptide repeat protein [Arcicella rigui]